MIRRRYPPLRIVHTFAGSLPRIFVTVIFAFVILLKFYPGDMPWVPFISCGQTQQEARGVVGVSHAAGRLVRDIDSEPPSVAEVQSVLGKVATGAGQAVGAFKAALDGAPKPMEPVTPGTVQASDPGCGSPCPTLPGGPGGTVQASHVTGGPALAASAAKAAGFTGPDLVTAVAVAGAESGYNPAAANPSSTARGMWQIMLSAHRDKLAGMSWADPYDSAVLARRVWLEAQAAGRDPWTPWEVYTTGAYRQHVAEAERAVGPVAVNAGICSTPVAAFPTQTGDYARAEVDGKIVNVRTLRMLQAAAELLGGWPRVMQGSHNPGRVAASGGTHDGGGVVDTSYVGSWERTVEALRQVGFAAWHRTPDQRGWGHHIHAVAIGDRDLSPEAASQVRSFLAGGDGLAGTPDPPAVLAGR